jgi:hypothetical protein
VGGIVVDEGPVVYSYDLLHWVQPEVPVYIYLEDVAYGNDVFVAVGSLGQYPHEYCAIIASPDGVNWQSVFNCSQPGLFFSSLRDIVTTSSHPLISE